MKILHYTPSIDRCSGGVGSYMQLLAKELGRVVELHVVTHRSDNELLLESCQLHYIDKWKHWRKMKRQWMAILNELCPHVVHINCCWQPESAMTQRWAHTLGYPTVYSPHGMLEPWILRRHYLLKKLPALVLYQKAAIRHSDVIHATAESERQNILKLGYNRNVAVIANGIDVHAIRMKESWTRTKTILFLSRIHVKKGINYLIESVAALSDQMAGYRVLIAGEGEESYIQELARMARQKGVGDIVEFVGGVYGERKWELFRSADLFVLPTHSENFGIVVAEALASGTPVITTKGTPWEELETCKCGWWTEIGTNPTREALSSFLAMSDADLEQMGRNGRRLMEERYSVEAIALQMKQLYEWVLGKGDRPEFVNP